MSKPKMRYSWWTDRPRNVSHREYSRWQLITMGAAITGFFAFGSAVMALTGSPLKESEMLAQLDSMSVAEAVGHQGDSLDLVKLEGFLVSEDTQAMPDDESQEVIRGELVLTARTIGDTEDALTETLLDWRHDAEQVFLSDGDKQIPLAFPVTQLPIPPAEGVDRPAVETEGRFKPTAVTYAGSSFPLEEEKWEQTSDSVVADLERRALLYGQSVVVVAGLDVTDTGNQLSDPLGNRLMVKIGTEAEILAANKSTRRLFAVLWIPLAIASGVLARSSYRTRQTFVERSNSDNS